MNARLRRGSGPRFFKMRKEAYGETTNFEPLISFSAIASTFLNALLVKGNTV